MLHRLRWPHNVAPPPTATKLFHLPPMTAVTRPTCYHRGVASATQEVPNAATSSDASGKPVGGTQTGSGGAAHP